MPIKIPFPELLFPYSTVAKPMPVPPVQSVCEGDLVCVQFSCSLVPYLLGLLEVYRYKDSFKGTDEEKTIAVGVMRQLMEVLAMSGCGCDDDKVIIHRINPDTGAYENSEDNGETWETSPDSPYVQATQAVPLGGVDGDAKRCQAANNVIYNMKILQAKYSGMIGTIEDIEKLIIGVLVEGAAMLFLPLIGDVLVALLSPLLLKVIETVQFMFSVTNEQYDALFTDDNWKVLQCILYCNGNGNGKYTDGDIQTIISQTKNQLGAGAQQAGANMASMIDFWSTVGTNNAARIGNGADDTCGDCNCGNCSNLDDWSVIYGTILEQSAGYMRLASTDAGSGNQAVRIANYSGSGSDCCAVTYNIISGVANNQAYYPCGSGTPVFSVPPAETCMYDIGITNVFSAAMEIEFFFLDCP